MAQSRPLSVWRDLALFVLGALLLLTFLAVWVLDNRPPDPSLLALAGIMLGLPRILDAVTRKP